MTTECYITRNDKSEYENLYFQRSSNADGSHDTLVSGNHRMISPARFRAGDAVEVQVSFIAMQTKGRSSMRVVMRAISILDSTITDVRVSVYLLGLRVLNVEHRRLMQNNLSLHGMIKKDEGATPLRKTSQREA